MYNYQSPQMEPKLKLLCIKLNELFYFKISPPHDFFISVSVTAIF